MQVSFFVHNEAGDILRTGYCPASGLMQQAVHPGETVRQGKADDASQRWDSVSMRLVDLPPVTPTENEKWAGVRNYRNQLLTACDWTQLPDVPTSTQAIWATYRRALRDITLYPSPDSVIWPKPPA